MKRLLEWGIRQWHQNVIGTSPPPDFKTWQDLASELDWLHKSNEQKQLKCKRLEKEFDDETALMFETFKKLMGTLTVAGIVFAITGSRLINEQTLIASLFIVGVCVSIIFIIWALSTRAKVMKRPQDSSLAALKVLDGIDDKGNPIDDEYAADAWYYYRWKWHRYCTRLAIDRLFFMACAMLATTVGCIGLVALVF